MLRYLSILILLCTCYIRVNALVIKDSACDVITLKNGKLIYCKIVNPGRKTITYAPCGDLKGPTSTVSVDSVTMVNFPDGHYQMVTPGNGAKIQPTEKPLFMISSYVNSAIPIGAYSNNNPDPSNSEVDIYRAGYATKDIGGAFIFDAGKTIGVSLLINYAHMPIDVQSFFNGNYETGKFVSFYSSTYGHPLNYAPIKFNPVSQSYYNNYGIMVGVKQSVGNQKIVVTFREMFGDNFVHLQPMNASVEPTSYNISTSSVGISDIEAGLGLGLSIRFTTHFFASINATFMFSTSTGINLNSELMDSKGNSLMTIPVETTSGFSTFQAGIGVGYGL